MRNPLKSLRSEMPWIAAGAALFAWSLRESLSRRLRRGPKPRAR